MSDLTAFLEARISEDEADAQRAGRFRYNQPSDSPWASAASRVEHGVALSADRHTARWDPARVLADCTARRQIIELHGVAKPTYERPPMCNMCGVADGYYDVPWPCPTLLALAAPYADHPDFAPTRLVGAPKEDQ